MSHLSATAVLIFALISISAALPAERRSRDSARFQDTRRPYLGREMIGRFQSYPRQYFGTTQQAKECSGGKVYDTCGSGCPPTCDNLSPQCTKECNAGCFCPEGLVDVAGECVEPSVCHTVCSLPPETGRCRAAIPRFFYNATSAACEQFIYGGCEGNGNNFETLEQCHARCRNYGPSSEPPPKCPRLMEYNQCGTACPPTCENPNLIQPCTKLCIPGCFCPPGLVEFNGKCIHAAQCPNFCQHEPDAGVCKAKIPMFFRNATSGMCELFIYGGCGGNGNKFKTFHECYVKCVLPDAPVPRIIESPSIEGPKLSGGQTWINDKCNGLIIRTVDLSSGIFYGFYHQGLRPRYYVTGQVNPEANTVAFTVSWRNSFTNFLAVSAYSGHLQYLANGDKVFRSTYILTRKGGRTEIGSDVFYPLETAPPIGCPRK